MTHEQPYCAMLGAIRSSLGFIMMRNAVHLKCTSSPKSGFECGPSFYTAAATFVSDFITNLGRGPHSLTRRVLTLPSLTGGECCEEPFTRKGLAKSLVMAEEGVGHIQTTSEPGATSEHSHS